MKTRKEYLNRLKQKKIILFGAGDYARRFFRDFKDILFVEFCISNNDKENYLVVDGKEVLPVYRVEDGIKKNCEAFIVLCAANYYEMEEQIGWMGYSYGKNYIHCDLLRLLFSQKKIAVAYGVCYMRAIHDCLKSSEVFSREYEVYYWLSYRDMSILEYKFFTFMLGICDLYLYNACIIPRERMKNDGLLSRLPKDCRTIRVPVIMSALYYPQTLNARPGDNPYCVVSRKTYWAPFLSPDWNVNKLLEQNQTSSEILKIISDRDYYPKEWLQKNYDREFRKIQIQEAMADIKISDYLAENHGKERLFLNETHISNKVIIELTKRILNFLEYDGALPERDLEERQLLCTSEVPLYPSVIRGLSLGAYQGENVQYNLFTFRGRKRVTFEEYVTLYCDFCGNMMRYIEYGLFPE